MKYFNKEDIEYKNEIESIERKFGEQNGINLLSNNYGTTSSSNPNNTDITYIGNDPFKFEIYPKTGRYDNVESNVQILKQKLSVKDPIREILGLFWNKFRLNMGRRILQTILENVGNF